MAGALVLVWRGYGRDVGGRGDAKQPIITVRPEKRLLSTVVTARGTVEYRLRPPVLARRSGTVTSMNQSVGGVVVAGTELARIDDRPIVAVSGDLILWRDLQRGARGEDVAKLQSMLAAEVAPTLVSDGIFDRQTETALKQWQAVHGFVEPDGRVVPGDVVTGSWPARIDEVLAVAGSITTAGSPLLAMSEPDAAVVAQVDQVERMRVAPGMTAEVQFDAAGDTRRGTILSVASRLTLEGESAYYAAILEGVDLVNVPGGIDVTVTIVLAEAPDALTIPVAAIVPGDQGSPSVLVLNADGSYRTVEVVLGMSDGAWVEVDGLSSADNVVVGST